MTLTADQIRTLVLQAIFSNDRLANLLTLKGGNALKIQGHTNRESQDLDFSIREHERLAEKDSLIIENSLKSTFSEVGFDVIAYKFKNKPRKRKITLPDFWGGYKITFCLIAYETKETLSDKQLKNINAYATPLENEKKTIEIDLSFDEYTDDKEEFDLDGLTIYVYSPLMIIYEKIRAICQQLPDYKLVSNKTARARDLYDIYTLLTNKNLTNLLEDVLNPQNFYILEKIFKVKDVDLNSMTKIDINKNILKEDYEDTVIPQIPSNDSKPDFDYLFNYNVDLFNKINSIRLDQNK